MSERFPGDFYHVGVATRDLDEGMAALGSLFGLEWAHVVPGVDQNVFRGPDGETGSRLRRVAHTRRGPIRFELLEGEVGSIWHTTEPLVLHHVAYWVADLHDAIATMQADGWTRELTMLDDDGRPETFAYMTRPGSARVELDDSYRREDVLARLEAGPSA